MRCFVAIELDPALRGYLAGLSSALAGEASGAGVKIRWVAPPLLHLTLRFLGEVSEEQLPAIQGAMTAAARAPSFTVAPSGLGFLPSATRPRVVYMGLSASALSSVVEALEQGLIAAGLPAADRPFLPHI